MKTIAMRKYLKPILAMTLSVSLILAGCKKDEDIPDQPELPPENAFVTDMSGFGSEQARSNVAYNFSALNVGIWNTLLYLTLVIPVAAWYEVRTDTPEWNKDAQAWEWTKDFNNLSGNYTATLQGKVNENGVIWEMYLTKEGDYEDFLWYEGQAEVDVTSGSWTLYRSPDDSETYMNIEWNNTIGSDLDDIKYINAIPGHEGEGGYIHYGVVDDPDYDVFYNIYGAEEDRLIEIDYNRESTSGRVRDDVFFGTEDWNCWNELHEDVDC